MSSDPLSKEICIEAPPQVVFEFLTDPVKMLRWMGVAAQMEAKPGGIYRLNPNGRDIIRGEYLEVVPNSKVVFTWGFEQPGHQIGSGATIVEIHLEPRGSGTWVRLIHRDLPPELRERHAMGWAHYLSRLRATAEGHDPGPDPYASPEIRHG